MANEQNIKLWIEALRSGKYKQGQYRLRQNNEFCCLGVACEIYDLIHANELPKLKECEDYYENNNNQTLPLIIGEWLGVDDCNPSINITEIMMEKYPELELYSFEKTITLAELNDDVQLSFDQIADIIEDNFLEK